jgi:two-component system, LytTR family, sensor kinase
MRFKISRYWWFQILGWGTFAVVNVFFAFSFDRLNDAESRRVFFIRLGFFLLNGVVFTHLMRFVIIRLNILQKRLEIQAFQFFLVTLFFSIISSLVDIEFLTRFDLMNKNQKELLDNKLLLISSVAIYFFVFFFIWTLIYFMYHYVLKSQKQQLDTLRLESLVKELELKTIKAHINPHFIFNSLNSIRALVDENPLRARKAVTELSNILRSSMSIENSETVPFHKELDIVKDYLALEHMRFEDRLKIEYDIDEETLDLEVPPMMLQTMAENAIKHGISKEIKGGEVKIISRFNENFHELSVINTGNLNGFYNEEGFGIASTKSRLDLLFGKDAKFELSQIEPNHVEAKLLIPIELN